MANAVATQRLEGLEPETQTIADLERVVRGEIEVADVLRNLHRRIAAGEFSGASNRRGGAPQPSPNSHGLRK